MDRYALPLYAHRRNSDGSHDSICTLCYATVATARSEAHLAQHEHDHVCNSYWPYESAARSSLNAQNRKSGTD
jgi:hypothetical protein